MDKIQTYRQPMVTVTGILLGFILNAMSSWLPEAFSKSLFTEIVLTVTFSSCVTILIIVLYRILNKDYPIEYADQYYKRTLILFIIGLSSPFIAMFLLLIKKLF